MVFTIPLRISERVTNRSFQRFVELQYGLNSLFVYLPLSHKEFIPEPALTVAKIIGYKFTKENSFVIIQILPHQMELWTTLCFSNISIQIIPCMIVDCVDNPETIKSITSYVLYIT